MRNRVDEERRRQVPAMSVGSRTDQGDECRSTFTSVIRSRVVQVRQVNVINCGIILTTTKKDQKIVGLSIFGLLHEVANEKINGWGLTNWPAAEPESQLRIINHRSVSDSRGGAEKNEKDDGLLVRRGGKHHALPRAWRVSGPRGGRRAVGIVAHGSLGRVGSIINAALA
jgi:hypothetical protein